MPVSLSPAEVKSLTGASVSQTQIDAAADQIEYETGATPDEHVDSRDISEASVRAAWARVTVRLDERMRNEADAAVIGETQGDYSYTEDRDLAIALRTQPLCEGLPSQLLRLRYAHGGSTHI